MTQETPDPIEPIGPQEKTNKSLSEIFGTAPMTVVVDEHGVSVPMEENESKNIDADADQARKNLYHILKRGDTALDLAIKLAEDSESPRAIEVIGGLIKNLADINMQIIGVHEAKNKAKGKTAASQEPSQPNKVVSNTIVFNGSTADLSKMISDMRKENE